MEKMKTYAGIGSRETPAETLKIFTNLGKILAEWGLVLRSGGAEGADKAFASMVPDSAKEIFIPWKGFQGVDGILIDPAVVPKAMEIAKEHHPAWGRCTPGAMKLHARNVSQILGSDLESLTDLVICWTPKGQGGGGTGQALRIAKAHGVPIIDFGSKGLEGQRELARRIVKRVEERNTQ